MHCPQRVAIFPTVDVSQFLRKFYGGDVLFRAIPPGGIASRFALPDQAGTSHRSESTLTNADFLNHGDTKTLRKPFKSLCLSVSVVKAFIVFRLSFT